jgi:tryptophan-rich sensory protein
MRSNARIKGALGLALWLVVCFLGAAIGATASLQAGTFYAELVRPEWAPPSAVFGPVWTVLYAMMGVAAWLIWERRKLRLARIGLVFFVAQLVLNALWSWLFFGWNLGALSFLDIALLWALILMTLAMFWRIRPLAGLLLVPYLAWVTFASALNYQIWQMNPSMLASGEAEWYASPPNKGMQLTAESVTPFAGAKRAPLSPAADPRR